MIRAVALTLAACGLLAGCGVDGAPIPPTRALHAGPVVGG